MHPPHPKEKAGMAGDYGSRSSEHCIVTLPLCVSYVISNNSRNTCFSNFRILCKRQFLRSACPSHSTAPGGRDAWQSLRPNCISALGYEYYAEREIEKYGTFHTCDNTHTLTPLVEAIYISVLLVCMDGYGPKAQDLFRVVHARKINT